MPAVNRGRCFRSMAESLFIIKFPADKEKLSASNFCREFSLCMLLIEKRNGFFQSVIKGDRRRPAETFLCQRRRETGAENIARAGRPVLYRDIFFGQSNHFFRQCSQRHFRAGADVADGATAPCERGQIGGDDIVDVDKITGLFACAEDRERFYR